MLFQAYLSCFIFNETNFCRGENLFTGIRVFLHALNYSNMHFFCYVKNRSLFAKTFLQFWSKVNDNERHIFNNFELSL